MSEAGREVIRYDGPLNDQAYGWRFIESKEGEKVPAPFAESRGDTNGRIESPHIPLRRASPQASYYELTFRARMGRSCYWWVDLFDAEGQLLPDINSMVTPEEELQDYTEVIYVERLAETVQLAFAFNGGVAVEDVCLREISWQGAAQWCDDVYAALPPLDFRAPADAFDLLPRTAGALRNGQPWNVVMLGDSNMNDTFTSVFPALVQRDFPNSALNVIISVRGSTGCWYYAEPEHFAEDVAAYRPDLLMIGGISNLIRHRDNLPAAMETIAQVIDQARAVGSEVVLMSPSHSVDWRPYDPDHADAELAPATWTEETLDPKGVKRLEWSIFEEQARKSRVAFWNMTLATTDYLAASGKPHHFFNRDYVHNNDRGKQILGRVLRRYFLTAQAR